MVLELFEYFAGAASDIADGFGRERISRQNPKDVFGFPGRFFGVPLRVSLQVFAGGVERRDASAARSDIVNRQGWLYRRFQSACHRFKSQGSTRRNYQCTLYLKTCLGYRVKPPMAVSISIFRGVELGWHVRKKKTPSIITPKRFQAH